MGYLDDITKQIKEEQGVIFVGTGILIIDEYNRILMGKRTDNKEWSLPGGSLEVGESLEECICREVLEETGIRVSINSLNFNSVKVIEEPVYKNGRLIHVVSIAYWTKEYNDIGLDINPREFEDYRWLGLDEIKRLESITPYSKVAIREYQKKMQE